MNYVEMKQINKSLSAMGFGCMGMSEFYGERDDRTSLKVLHKAYELGINFFDTADMYGQGHNEELLAQFISDKRSDIVLATKFGIKRKDSGEYGWIVDNSKEYIRNACEASLKRLNTDFIDLYYLHRFDPQWPVEETVETLSMLVKEGKIGAIGLSEVSAETIKAAHAVFPISAVQTEYSLWSRDIEYNSILGTTSELGISLVSYSPLGRGFLTGKIKADTKLSDDDFRKISPRFSSENFDKNFELVRQIENIAAEKGCTSGQLALAWIMGQNKDIIPIPGTKRITYLEENCAASDILITEEEKLCLDSIFAPENVCGTRYPEEVMSCLPA